MSTGCKQCEVLAGVSTMCTSASEQLGERAPTSARRSEERSEGRSAAGGRGGLVRRRKAAACLCGCGFQRLRAVIFLRGRRVPRVARGGGAGGRGGGVGGSLQRRTPHAITSA